MAYGEPMGRIRTVAQISIPQVNRTVSVRSDKRLFDRWCDLEVARYAFKAAAR